MTWLKDGSLKCDTCENTLIAHGSSEKEMREWARAARWGIFFGLTHDGRPFSTVSCKWCRTNSHKRAIRTVQSFEDTPLWEESA